MSQIFRPQTDNRTEARKVIDRIVERAIDTESQAIETIATAIRAMEKAFTETRKEFWEGPIPASDLLSDLGTDAQQFLRESYMYAEQMKVRGSTIFDQQDAQGNDTTRDRNGFLTLALPPVELVYHADGSVTIK
jgi:hypothetical protein